MSRSLQTAVKTAILAQYSRVALFVRLEFYTAAVPPVADLVRLTDYPLASGVGLSWTPEGESAQTWYNLGGALTLAPLPEAPGVNVAKVTITLQNADIASVTEKLLNGRYINRAVAIYAAHLDESLVPLTYGYLLFRGQMNGGAEITESVRDFGPPESTVKIEVTSEIAELDKVVGIYTSLQSHQQLFAGDLFFEYVPWLNNAEQRITWGKVG